MAMLYRIPVIVRRKAPFVAWANGFEDGVILEPDRASIPSTYLLAVPDDDASLDQMLRDSWMEIFEQELSQWMRFERDWPADRTRETFDQWFDVELGDLVFDLAPDQPLTDDDLDAVDLQHTMRTCAWCGVDLGEDGGRWSAFSLPDRERFEDRQGRVLSLLLRKRVVMGIVTFADSEAASRGDDLVFRVCNRACDQPLKKYVPKALELLKTMED